MVCRQVFLFIMILRVNLGMNRETPYLIALASLLHAIPKSLYGTQILTVRSPSFKKEPFLTHV